VNVIFMCLRNDMGASSSAAFLFSAFVHKVLCTRARHPLPVTSLLSSASLVPRPFSEIEPEVEKTLMRSLWTTISYYDTPSERD